VVAAVISVLDCSELAAITTVSTTAYVALDCDGRR